MSYKFLDEKEKEQLSEIYTDGEPDLFLTGSTIRVTAYDVKEELVTLLKENEDFEYRQVMSLDYYTLKNEEHGKGPQARLIKGENEPYLTITIGSPENEDELASEKELADVACLVGRTGKALRKLAEQQLE